MSYISFSFPLNCHIFVVFLQFPTFNFWFITNITNYSTSKNLISITPKLHVLIEIKRLTDQPYKSGVPGQNVPRSIVCIRSGYSLDWGILQPVKSVYSSFDKMTCCHPVTQCAWSCAGLLAICGNYIAKHERPTDSPDRMNSQPFSAASSSDAGVCEP